MAIAGGKVTVKSIAQTGTSFNINLGDVKPELVEDVMNSADSTTQKAAATVIDAFTRAANQITNGTYEDSNVTATISTNLILFE